MNRNLLLLGITLSGLFGCAPLQITCKVPMPPEELVKEPPPPGWFQDQLDKILDRVSTHSPDERMN